MIRLFQEVEGRMNNVGSLLFRASKGETEALNEISNPGIDELLKKGEPQASTSGAGSSLASMLQVASAEGDSILTGIDKILEIANEQGGGQCSSAMQQNSQGNQPDGQPSGEQGKSQEQQETGKKKDQSASDPKEGTGQQEPKQQGEQAIDGKQSDAEPTPSKAGKTPERPTAGVNHRDPKNEAWGNLPIHLRDIFRAEGGVEVPAQYRDWIDSYYRRLNRRGE